MGVVGVYIDATEVIEVEVDVAEGLEAEEGEGKNLFKLSLSAKF